MPIEVKHGANPTSTLYARYGGAEGKASRTALERWLRSREIEQAQSREHGFRDYMSDKGYAHTMDRDRLEHAQTMERQGALLDHRQDEFRASEILRQGRIGNEQEYRRQLQEEGYELKLSNEQRADEAKLRNALYQIEQDPTLSPEEKQEARLQVNNKLAGINLLPSRKPDSPWAEGQGIGEMFYHEGYGGYVARDDKGILKEMSGGWMSQSEAWKIALDRFTNDEGVVDYPAAEAFVARYTGRGGQGGGGATGEQGGSVGGGERLKRVEKVAGDLDVKILDLEGDDIEAELTTEQVDPGKTETIAATKQQIATWEARLYEHRKKHGTAGDSDATTRMNKKLAEDDKRRRSEPGMPGYKPQAHQLTKIKGIAPGEKRFIDKINAHRAHLKVQEENRDRLLYLRDKSEETLATAR